jgi:hypothetical protein
MMTKRFSVVDLYPVALLEGEGMGTAFEYSVKLKMLHRAFKFCLPPRQILIGGLPEAYGVDLALALFAAQYDSRVVVADDRLPMLEKFADALQSLQLSGLVNAEHFEMRHLETLADPTRPDDVPFDLWITTSSIQRLTENERAEYLAQVRENARCAAILVANEGHKAHQNITGIKGFFLPDLVSMCQQAGLAVQEANYLDMPPFPPGITRSTEAKENAAQSSLNRAAMHILEWAVHVERFWPRLVRQRFSHIAYVILQA